MNLQNVTHSPWLAIAKESLFAFMLLVVLWKLSVIGPQVHEETRLSFEKALDNQTTQFIEAVKEIQARSTERHVNHQEMIVRTIQEIKESNREHMRLIGALLARTDLTPQEFNEAVKESAEITQ